MTERRLKSALGRALAGVESRAGAGEASPAQVPDGKASTGRAQPMRFLDTMGQGVETQDIFEVETERCVLWPFHNRLYDLLTETECGDLIESIRTHGQMVPVIGRRRHTKERADIEIVSGARRLWVARYLKLRIRIEIRAMSDEEAFVVSEDSNRYSDITPFERAREYQHVLAAVFDGNQARMAARINLSPAQLNRHLALAELPDPVVRAFPDPRKITLELAAKIRSALKTPGAEKRMMAAAAEMASKQESRDAESIARALLGTRGRKPGGVRPAEIKGANGEVLFTLEKRKREVLVKIPRDKVGAAHLARLIGEALAKIS